MNSFIIPFDYNPVNTSQTASSYTVPSGKYAIAKISLSATVFLNDETPIQPNANGSFSSSSENSFLEIVLNDGDILTKSEVPANKTVTLTNNVVVTAGAVSEASVSVNTGSGATKVASIKAQGSLLFSSGATIDTLDIDGTAEVYWHIQEYDVLT